MNRIGTKQYELTDHLGNVVVTVLDRRTGIGNVGGMYTGWRADVHSVSDYYPFGMQMASRSISQENYRFGYNQQEKTDEISGNGNHNTAHFWEYDTRIARRWNLDPVDQISISNFAAFGLNPIYYIDNNGDRVIPYSAAVLLGQDLTDVGDERLSLQFQYKNAIINPIFDINNKLIGYNVYDALNKDNKFPILQMTASDLQNFGDYYDAYMYQGREVASASEGHQKVVASQYGGGNRMFWDGIMQANIEAWSDPIFVAQMIVGVGGAGTRITLRNSRHLPVQYTNTTTQGLKNYAVVGNQSAKATYNQTKKLMQKQITKQNSGKGYEGFEYFENGKTYKIEFYNNSTSTKGPSLKKSVQKNNGKWRTLESFRFNKE